MDAQARVHASLKGLRGTALDVLKNTDERRMEQQLKVDYRRLIEEVVAKLAPHNHSLAVQLARIPEDIRGYDHVKERHFKVAKATKAKLKAAFDASKMVIAVATSETARAA